MDWSGEQRRGKRDEGARGCEKGNEDWRLRRFFVLSLYHTICSSRLAVVGGREAF